MYVDLNGPTQCRDVVVTPGRGASAGAIDAWEYALCFGGDPGTVLSYRGVSYEMSDSVQLTVEGNRVKFSIPTRMDAGNPKRWGINPLVMVYDPKSLENDPRPLITPDMLVSHRTADIRFDRPSGNTQAPIINDIEEGKRNDIPSCVFLPATNVFRLDRYHIKAVITI